MSLASTLDWHQTIGAPPIDCAARRPVKVLVHDYSGHAPTARLARALCDAEHAVSYVSFAGFPSPKGRTGREPDDPLNFSIAALDIPAAFDKENLFRRYLHERAYARRLVQFVAVERPDVVLSANAPLGVQAALLELCEELDAAFVFWCQDIQGEAIGWLLGRRNRPLGAALRQVFRHRERQLLEASDAVIVIAESFRRTLAAAPWRLDTSEIEVIENIAPLAEFPPLSRDNAWARGHFRPGRKRLVYTGTLARKHNPQMLLHLARHVDADVWLFSQGASVDQLVGQARREGVENLFVRPWVEVGELGAALAGADVLCALLEADASCFSVPSKVLSYMAAGRPVVAAMPADNLAAETIARAGAGTVVAPGDFEGLVAAARHLLADPEGAARMGQAGRAFAEQHFDLEVMCDRLRRIVARARSMRARRRRAS
jgi:colanic acid biosynthesis glycosyl transferase WcaI